MTARTKARKRALDLLFEAEARGVNARELLDERLAEPVTPAPLPAYTGELIRGVVSHWVQIDDALTTYASAQWPPSRMPAVDRALCRLATWEIVWNDEVPDKVAIAEAVHLATDLSTDDSPRFLSGLLSKIADVKTSLR